MPENVLVLSTAGSKEEARQIADALVEGELAACVNIIGPVESVFRWKGQVDFATEFQLVIKTLAEKFNQVRDCIAQNNTYELPECIEVPISSGSEAYLKWISESVKK